MPVEQIKIPDIGSDSAEVIEILVNVGDMVDVDQSLAVLESDKASLEMPCPKAGKVVSIALSVGDQVSEGGEAIELEVNSEDADVEETVESSAENTLVVENPMAAQAPASGASSTPSTSAAVPESVLCLVPDIGADEAEVIEISVSVGDEIMEGDSIVVVESDKASLEIPAELDGVVATLHVEQGDKIHQGSELVTINGAATMSSDAASTSEIQPSADTAINEPEPPVLEDVVTSVVASAETYTVPDIGSDSAEVIEISVSVGEEILEGDSVCVVETDKASVEIPAPASGTIEEIFVSAGDQIGQGKDLIRILGTAEASSAVPTLGSDAQVPSSDSTPTQTPAPAEQVASPASTPSSSKSSSAPSDTVSRSSSEVYAGPAVRKHARELGVDLALVKGSGQRGRILREDVNQFVKGRMESASLPSTGAGAGLPEIPATDWSKFGETSVEPMSRIHKATAANMVRNWLNVPHVTQFDNADVTELETYRGYSKAEAQSRGIKMTPLAFLLKASAVALAENPKMNSSVHHNGDDLVYREFFHISIAVDTPAGLMVPVIRDVDQKDIWELAADIAVMATKAKEGRLGAKEMQGASFTISSLGAMGGTGFTPIVPAPQAGILGVSKTSIQPVWDGKNFVPRKMMPLALSYDHRVVNGADAGKFMTTLVAVLEDLDRIWNG